MDMINALLTWTASWLLRPFHDSPTAGLLFWSAVTGVVMAYVFGKTSNQTALRRAADTIRAQLFAVKLFKDDLWVTFQCQLKLLKATGKRLLHSIPPMLVMMAPLLFVLTQLAMRYEFRPLVQGERTVVAMHVNPDTWKTARNVVLETNEGVVVETEPLRDEKNATIYWRVRAEGGAPQSLHWQMGEQRIAKLLPMSLNSDHLEIANPRRPGASVWDRFLYPAESGFAANGPVESIDIQLQPRETPVLGWAIPWWATFFIVSMLVAFVAGKWMGVQY